MRHLPLGLVSRCSAALISVAIIAFSHAQTPTPTPAPKANDDLLLDDTAVIVKAVREAKTARGAEDADMAHTAILRENRFPSANTCATCHPKQFEEWSASAHAQALVSPTFNAAAATFVKRLNGTMGDFCIRCHAQAAAQMKEPVFMPMLERHPSSLEGISCINCHRVAENYGRVAGRTALLEGDVTAPVLGAGTNETLKKLMTDPSNRLVSEPSAAAGGRLVHGDIIKFEPITRAHFCASCHDSPLPSGLRGQELITQYKNSPAPRRGETCQDCHMGKIPGIASGFDEGPAAVIGGVGTPTRKHSNHMFAGPDYPLVHPGIFPFNPKAQQLATAYEWLQFDADGGWGTDAFENKVARDFKFPARWKAVDDRYEARKILHEQFRLRDKVTAQRYALLRRGYQLGQFVVDRADAGGLKFKVEVRNGTDGHNVPGGFDQHRLVFLEVTVTDPSGRVVFRSGDRDPNGDVRDALSAYVRNWEVPKDGQLFSLMSNNVTTNIRGGDMPTVLSVPQSPDPLPYFRPATRSALLYGRPPTARKQTNSLPPNGSAWADYKVSAKELGGSGPFNVKIRFIAQSLPVNFVNDIKEVGFDYNMSPREVARRLVDGAMVLYEKDITVTGSGQTLDLKPTEAEIVAPPPSTPDPVLGRRVALDGQK